MVSPADKVEGLKIKDDHGQDAKVQLPLLLGAGGHIRLAVGINLGDILMTSLHYKALQYTVSLHLLQCTALHCRVL